MMPVLKANAYGHGLVEVARLMESLNADCLGVAFLEEAILLRENGIHSPILVLGGILGNQVPHFLAHDLTITASSIEKLQQVDDTAGVLKVRTRCI
jgi:alanine racemase